MSMNWQYDPKSETYLFGTQKHGCGAYAEPSGDPRTAKNWFANVSAFGQIINHGPFPSLDKAKEWAEKELERLDDVLGC